MSFDLVVVGGGAAGFFGAINAVLNNRNLNVVVLEKSDKFLSKVKISGGGRCNVTNAQTKISELVKNYPRGGNELRKIFRKFSTADTVEWFNNFGVRLKVEKDGRIFPISNKSETVINLFFQLANELNIKLYKGFGVVKVNKTQNGFEIISADGRRLESTKILITTGGYNKKEQYAFIENLGIEIVSPVPSLFTFNLGKHPITQLMGVSVKEAKARVIGFKAETLGPLLVTHWGMSGPAVLKLSAMAARYLAEKNYNFQFSINWLGNNGFEAAKQFIEENINIHPNGIITNYNIAKLPARLWYYIAVSLAEIQARKRWKELSKKDINKLAEALTNSVFCATGKTTFKEEFVTAGGVSLRELNVETMEAKKIAGLYFAGEVLDIDGVTGGFNFQAAWSTAYIAAVHLSN